MELVSEEPYEDEQSSRETPLLRTPASEIFSLALKPEEQLSKDVQLDTMQIRESVQNIRQSNSQAVLLPASQRDRFAPKR